MNRKIALFAALIAAFALTCQSANAGERHHHINKKIVATAVVVGAASTAAYFGMNNWRWNGWNNGSGFTRLGAYGVTSLGCAAVSPMVGTVLLNRALTQREGHILIGSCFLPIIGGWLVNEAYNAHPDWDPAGDAQMRMHHRKRHAKM
jgi:uncharacterized membrane protein YidH (DUF202 family)